MITSLAKKLIVKLGLLDRFIEYRQGQIIQEHKGIANLWQEKIEALKAGNIPLPSFEAKRPELIGKKIIWQFWGQGAKDMKLLPELIRPCFESVDRHRGDYEVIRIDNDSLAEYLDLPDFVFDRLQGDGGYNYTFLSDLIRIALLANYGGIWIDATIYLTGPIPTYCFEHNYFMYQRSEEEPLHIRKAWMKSFYAYWGWQPDFKVRHMTSFIVAKPRTHFIEVAYTLLLDYWRTEVSIRHYFIFQVLLHELSTGWLSDEACPVKSDVIPHLLAMSLVGKDRYLLPHEAVETTTLHKFNSKGPEVPQIIDFLWRQRTRY